MNASTSTRWLVIALAALAPAQAAAERIVTRGGEVFVGEPRFEGNEIVIRRADGSEVRLPRTEVERIELDGAAEEAAPREAPSAPRAAPPPPRGVPREGPTYPRYVPPPPPPPPDPSAGRRMLEHAGTRSGLLLATGYQRGLAIGAEWQQRLDRYVALGVGAQGGLAINEELACPTWGATARLYAGLRHRLVVEGGFGLNRIEPYLDLRPNQEATCGDAEVNLGPEAAIGYQYAAPSGFVFDAAVGGAYVTNDRIAEERADLRPLFLIRVGYLWR